MTYSLTRSTSFIDTSSWVKMRKSHMTAWVNCVEYDSAEAGVAAVEVGALPQHGRHHGRGHERAHAFIETRSH